MHVALLPIRGAVTSRIFDLDLDLDGLSDNQGADL